MYIIILENFQAIMLWARMHIRCICPTCGHVAHSTINSHIVASIYWSGIWKAPTSWSLCSYSLPKVLMYGLQHNWYTMETLEPAIISTVGLKHLGNIWINHRWKSKPHLHPHVLEYNTSYSWISVCVINPCILEQHILHISSMQSSKMYKESKNEYI